MFILNEEIISKIHARLLADGMPKEEIGNQLNDVISVCVLSLPPVCIVKENRPSGTSSNQVHIHATGDCMHFFYPKYVLDSKDPNLSKDVKQLLILSSSNLKALAQKSNVKLLQSFSNLGDELIPSYTLKKIGHNGSQVQLSKVRSDASSFIMLRKLLFENDVLVFVKRNNHDEVFTFGINSNDFYTMGINPGLYETPQKTYDLPTSDNNTSHYEAPNRQTLRKVSLSDIANYTPSDEDDSNLQSKIFDLSNGIAARKNRTERHQEIVKFLALDLTRGLYELYENPIDCLAIKADFPPLLFEVKTLDGSARDEHQQVTKAFSQVFYYEAFNLPSDFTTCKKIVVFENKISDEHIAFFTKNSILVAWLDSNHNLVVSTGEKLF